MKKVFLLSLGLILGLSAGHPGTEHPSVLCPARRGAGDLPGGALKSEKEAPGRPGAARAADPGRRRIFRSVNPSAGPCKAEFSRLTGLPFGRIIALIPRNDGEQASLPTAFQRARGRCKRVRPKRKYHLPTGGGPRPLPRATQAVCCCRKFSGTYRQQGWNRGRRKLLSRSSLHYHMTGRAFLYAHPERKPRRKRRRQSK